jgi:hypothetical protein
MKRKSILGVFFVAAIVAGFSHVDHVSAQKRVASTVKPSTVLSPQAVSPIRVDDFNYATGALTDVGGANVSGGNWVSNTGTGNFLQVTAGSLSYAGYPSSGIGNKLSVIGTTSSAEDTFRNFPTQTAGTVYAAFLVNVTDTVGLAANSSTTGDYFAGMISSTSTSSHVARIYIRAGSVANTYNLGIKGTTTNAVAFQASPTDLPVGTTALLVVSYQIVAGATNDVVNLFINPVITNPEPAPSITQTTLGTDSTDIGRFFFRQGSAGTPNASEDGVRIGTSWASLIATYLSPAPLDFNGDGRTDWAITRANGGLKEWWIQMNNSASSVAGQFGLATDRAIPADYDGDGKADIAVWREAPATQAAFYIYQSSTGTVRTELFGQTGDFPTTVADYDGDGKADVSVYRSGASAGAQSYFYYRGSLNNPSGIITYVPWGINGDTQTVGDFDGDGKGDFCIRRDIGGQGTFILLRSSDSAVEFIPWGLPTDTIVPGDYDGDGKSDFCLARIVGGAGNFFILQRNGGGTGASPIVFGIAATDLLAPGDYDGDGKTDIAIWRANADPTQNYFWVRQASNGAVVSFEWGQSGDETPAEWNVSGGN